MLRFLSENLGLKLIAVGTSLMIWYYANAERNPITPKRTNAEVVAVGTAPKNLIVRLRSDILPVEINGPRNEVDSIADKDIKAIVNIATVHPDDREVAIEQLKAPNGTPNITFPHPKQSVPADVIVKQSKMLMVEPVYKKENPLGKVYGAVKLEPAAVSVSGSQSELQRVVKLQVYIETHGGNVNEELQVHAVDKEGIEVNNVQFDHPKIHVELSLQEAPTTRTLIVSARIKGKPATPYAVWEVVAKPDQVTVSGKSDQLL